jgi:hypothetical protein
MSTHSTMPALMAFAPSLDKSSYQRIYVAGPPTARVEFETLLPTGLRRRIAGRLSASLDSARLQHQLREEMQHAAAGV